MLKIQEENTKFGLKTFKWAGMIESFVVDVNWFLRRIKKVREISGGA